MTLIPHLPAQFINWTLDVGGKKYPCGPTGGAIDAHDPKNWLTYEQAVANKLPVGFDFTIDDPWFFLDLDKCLVDGAWTQESLDILGNFTGAAYEVSQSGTGLHIVGKCQPHSLQDRTQPVGRVERVLYQGTFHGAGVYRVPTHR